MSWFYGFTREEPDDDPSEPWMDPDDEDEED